MVCCQVQSEKLLTWNLAVRDFHILINLVKVLTFNPLILDAVCMLHQPRRLGYTCILQEEGLRF